MTDTYLVGASAVEELSATVLSIQRAPYRYSGALFHALYAGYDICRAKR